MILFQDLNETSFMDAEELELFGNGDHEDFLNALPDPQDLALKNISRAHSCKDGKISAALPDCSEKLNVDVGTVSSGSLSLR